MRFMSLALAGLMLAAGGAQAAGDALVIGNSRYGAVQSFFGAKRVVAAADNLRDAGLEVTEVSDADAQTMDRAFATFVDGLAPGDNPLIVVLAGAFLHGPGGAYLLPVDNRPNTDAASVLTRAFPLDAALAVLAQAPGRAFLVLGETANEVEAGPYLEPGLGNLQVPQGVTVIRGLAPDVAAYATRDMTRPNARLVQAALAYELQIEGFDPPWQVVLRNSDIKPPQPGKTPDQDTAPKVTEQADNTAWRLAQQADSAEGYQTYLEGFPKGLHASAARQRLAAIRAEPYYAARRDEEALGLSRNARRDIQRDLSLLGYNTRGIDGIFGPGTRGAIKQWQGDLGLPVSSYLDRSQIGRLDDAARAKAAELEAEAERRALELERQDNQLWRRVNGQGDETGLRRYLEQFPDGLHSDEARRLIAQIEERRAGSAAVQDRRAWDRARETDTIAAYRQYLSERPGGAFANQAAARIEDLNREESEARAVARARAEEEALSLNPVAMRLAEARLKQLKLKPGTVDGKFDKNTRRAIREYQRTRGLPVTGYMDEKTVVRLLADGILGR